MTSLGLNLGSCQTSSSIPANAPSSSASPANTIAAEISQDLCERGGAFVFIPKGPFYFGSTAEEVDQAYEDSAIALAASPDQVPSIKQKLQKNQWFSGEPPLQKLTLKAFCLQRNLVTNADYQAFTQATGHPVPSISAQDYQTQGFLVHPYKTVEKFLWQTGSYPPGKGNHPVVLVSYEDAIAYAQWQGQQDQASYRLPTDQEWEKAARGQDKRYFPWGNKWDLTATNAGHRPEQDTNAVGAFPGSRSPWGIEDMAGNVFEYTSTLRQQGNKRVSVMKGCSWDDLPGFCRAAYQHTRPILSRHILFGFRLVKQPDL